MNYLELAEELHVPDEELGKMAEDERERIDAEFLEELLATVCEQPNEDKQEKFKNESPLAKILYIAGECYLRGYAMGLYIFNDAVNEYCKERHEEVAKGV